MSLLLLAIETASAACSVALARGDEVIAEASLHRPRVHAEQLAPLIQDLLGRSALAPSDLDAVAVSMGPGSYTGLRIGVSTAKGLSLASGAALVGVPTLEALAASVRPFARPGDVIGVALDARRDDVYAAAYMATEREETGGGLGVYADVRALRVQDLAHDMELGGHSVWLVGDGAEKAAPALRDAGVNLRATLPVHTHPPSARWVAQRALVRFHQGETADVAAFEPFYLKAFQGTRPEQTPLERLSS